MFFSTVAMSNETLDVLGVVIGWYEGIFIGFDVGWWGRYCTWLTERLLGWSMCRLLFGLTLSLLWSPIHWSRRRWFDQLFWRSRSWIYCRLLRRLNGRVQGRLSAWRFFGVAVGWGTGWKEGLQISKLLSSNQLEIIIIITIIIIIISNS